GVGARSRAPDMTDHGIAARIQDTGDCLTDPPLRTEFNVPNRTFCLWSNGDSSYCSRHASRDLDRQVDEVFLPDRLRRNLTGADATQIRRAVRRARKSLLKWELSEAYELIDRIECA